jgi:hypothetical protein
LLYVGAAELNFGCPNGRFTADDGAARGIGADCRFAGVIEKNEPLHQGDAGGRGETGEGISVARGEEFGEVLLVVSACGGEDAAESSSGAGGGRCDGIGLGRRGWNVFLSARGCTQTES